MRFVFGALAVLQLCSVNQGGSALNRYLAIGVLFALAPGALAGVITGGPGAGFSIPDSGSAFSDITITNPAAIAGGLSVTILGFTHTWIGDLIGTLQHVESGTAQTLFHRVGRVSTGFGSNADFRGDYTFGNGGADLWAAAAGGGLVPPGLYSASGADSAAFLDLSNFFDGEAAAGTWRLTLSDNAGGDIGAITGWTLGMQVSDVPEPSMAIPLLAALVGGFALCGRARPNASV